MDADSSCSPSRSRRGDSKAQRTLAAAKRPELAIAANDERVVSSYEIALQPGR